MTQLSEAVMHLDSFGKGQVRIWARDIDYIGKYSFVNRTIQLWNQLPADALGTLSCKPNNFRKRIRKVINKAK
jgi:hypothetical protein